MNMINISRVLVFKLGGKGDLPRVETVEQVLPDHGLAAGSEERVAQGRSLYNAYCSVCHGGNAISGGLIPDLRYRVGALDGAWQAIVIDGGLGSNGMPGWADYLTREEADNIKAYVIHEASLGRQRGERRLVRK